MYRCKQCNLAVIHHEGVFHKGCTCNAPILAIMESSLKGVGGIVQTQQPQTITADNTVIDNERIKLQSADNTVIDNERIKLQSAD